MHVPLSIIIKTFERPDALSNLLRSIRTLGLKNPILIADDSQTSHGAAIKTMFGDLNITYIDLPFDSGLSAGRNALLDKVTTPYFLLCDDDYVFDERTDLGRVYDAITTSGADIVGGDYYNYVNINGLKMFFKQLFHPFRITRFLLNRYQVSRYLGRFTIEGDFCELNITHKRPMETLCDVDMVNNFFIARTEAVKLMNGWDKELKMGEHEDFFLRAKQKGLKVKYLTDFGTRHYPAIPVKSSAYNRYRVRAAEYKTMFVKKHGFKTFVERLSDTGKVIFEVNQ